MTTSRLTPLFLAAAAIIGLQALHAGAEAGDAGEVSRRVLAVYNAKEAENGEPLDTDIHHFLEKPLNHLGFAVDYADANQPLPDATRYRGAVVWLTSWDIEGPDRLLPWILDAMRSGVKMIFPAGVHAPDNPGGEAAQWEMTAEILAAFGLESRDAVIGANGDALRVNHLRPEFFSRETAAVQGQETYPVYATTREDVDVWQRVERADNPEEHSVGVVVGAAGGWAQTGSLLYYGTEVPGTIYRVAWNISPIDFLERALDCADFPRPDVATFWGARGAYSHVDADGPYNMSQPDVPGPSRFALEVAYEEIWKKYPYPVTLGLIASEYDPDIDPRFIFEGETPEQALARDPLDWERPQREVAAELRRIMDKIGALPQVQYGCHGYTHPLFWRDLTPSYAIPGYQPSYENEIRNAVRYLDERLLPPGKRVEIFQWTGDCDPPEEALDIVSDLGLANINGGDPLYDARHDSLYYICPLSVPKGRRRQIYTSGSNENIYTENWTGYRGAFNHAVSTFKRSESPSRLLPVNIYYHVFPAEHLAGYKAIQNAYDWAATQDLCWLTAAQYVRAAEDFFPVRIGRLDGGGWWVEDHGACPGVRFDREDRAVDMRTSRGVAGFIHHNGALYVSLLPGERAEIRLTSSRPDAPCLAKASGVLEDVRAGAASWSARLRGWGPGFIEVWAPPGDWRFAAVYPDGRREEKTLRPMADGRLRATLADAAGGWIEVGCEKE